MKLIINDVGVDPAILKLGSLKSLREEQHPKLISFTDKLWNKKIKGGKVHHQVHKVLGYGLHKIDEVGLHKLTHSLKAPGLNHEPIR
jgi:hypothetical protein